MCHGSWLPDKALLALSTIFCDSAAAGRQPMQVMYTRMMLAEKPKGGVRPCGLFCSLCRLYCQCGVGLGKQRQAAPSSSGWPWSRGCGLEESGRGGSRRVNRQGVHAYPVGRTEVMRSLAGSCVWCLRTQVGFDLKLGVMV